MVVLAFCAYFYCSEWVGVTMPGFENIIANDYRGFGSFWGIGGLTRFCEDGGASRSWD